MVLIEWNMLTRTTHGNVLRQSRFQNVLFLRTTCIFILLSIWMCLALLKKKIVIHTRVLFSLIRTMQEQLFNYSLSHEVFSLCKKKTTETIFIWRGFLFLLRNFIAINNDVTQKLRSSDLATVLRQLGS